MSQLYPKGDPRAAVIDSVADLLGGGRIVAYQVEVARAVGSATAGIWLSQLWFWVNHWSQTSKTDARRWDGEWFAWTQEEVEQQTALTRRESDTARKVLRELGVIDEAKRGLPMRIWFKLDKNRLYTLLRESAARAANNLGAFRQDDEGASPTSPDAPNNVGGNAQPILAFSAKMGGTNAPGNPGGIRQDIKEEIREQIIDISNNRTETDQAGQAASAPNSDLLGKPDSAVAVFDKNMSVFPDAGSPSEPASPAPLALDASAWRESHEAQWRADAGSDDDETIVANRETRLARLIVDRLESDGFAERDAMAIIREFGMEVAHRQLDLWHTRPRDLRNPGGYFRSCCQHDYPDPHAEKKAARARDEARRATRVVRAPTNAAPKRRAEDQPVAGDIAARQVISAPIAATAPMTSTAVEPTGDDQKARLDAIAATLSSCASDRLENEVDERIRRERPHLASSLDRFRAGLRMAGPVLPDLVAATRYVILAERADAPIMVGGRNYYDAADARAAQIEMEFS